MCIHVVPVIPTLFDPCRGVACRSDCWFERACAASKTPAQEPWAPIMPVEETVATLIRECIALKQHGDACEGIVAANYVRSAKAKVQRSTLSTIYNPQRTTYNLLPTTCNRQCTIHNPHCTMWIVDCGLWIVHCTLYNVDCGLWIVHCRLRVVRCTLYVVDCRL